MNGWLAIILVAVMALGGMRLYDRYWRVAPPPPAPVKVELPGVKEIPKSLPPQPLVQPKELEKLRRLARYSESAGDRATYLAKLIAVHDPQAPKQIADALATDTEPEVRAKAIPLLFETGDKELTLAALQRALIDDDRIVRLQVLSAIERLGDPAAASAVAETATNDNEPDVRAAALRTLGSLHDRARAEAEAKAQKQREAYENAVKERQLQEKLHQ